MNTGVVIVAILALILVAGLLYLMWDMHKDEEWLSKKGKE